VSRNSSANSHIRRTAVVGDVRQGGNSVQVPHPGEAWEAETWPTWERGSPGDTARLGLGSGLPGARTALLVALQVRTADSGERAGPMDGHVSPLPVFSSALREGTGQSRRWCFSFVPSRRAMRSALGSGSLLSERVARQRRCEAERDLTGHEEVEAVRTGYHFRLCWLG
jgi:hypothetical protein